MIRLIIDKIQRILMADFFKVKVCNWICTIFIIYLLYLFTDNHIGWQLGIFFVMFFGVIIYALRKEHLEELRIKEKAELHLKAVEGFSYKSPTNLNEWMLKIKQFNAKDLFHVEVYHEVLGWCDEDAWLRFIFFNKGNRNEVIIVDRFLDSGEIELIIEFCNNYGKSCGIEFNFKSLIHIYWQDNKSFYLFDDEKLRWQLFS